MTNTNQAVTLTAKSAKQPSGIGGPFWQVEFGGANKALCALEACSNGRLNYIATATYLDDENARAHRAPSTTLRRWAVDWAWSIRRVSQKNCNLYPRWWCWLTGSTLWLNNIILNPGDDTTNEQVEAVRGFSKKRWKAKSQANYYGQTFRSLV